MPHDFDPGPVFSPFQELVADYPGTDVYPAADFRVEWGPIFHRGRLDGTARVLVIGQDPAASEDITRRILVGEAGHRTQGLLAKLGVDRSYVMINTYLYSVYGQRSSDDNQQDEDIAEYRHRWLEAIAATSPLEAVIALGGAADAAWKTWKKATSSPAKDLPFAHVTHPTQPESSSHNDPVKRAAATKTMLKNWNGALDHLHPAVQHPDTPRPLVHYGNKFGPGDRADIPEADLPAGVPGWMRSTDPWAKRTGATAADKRRTVTITIPA